MRDGKKNESDYKRGKPSYLIHFIYAGSFLLSVMAIIFYLSLRDDEIRKQIELKYKEELVYKEERKKEYDECMKMARYQYEIDWAVSCSLHAKREKELLDHCMKKAFYLRKTNETINKLYADNIYGSQISSCKVNYGDIDKNPSCPLPANIAQPIVDNLKSNQCLKNGETAPP